MLVERSGTARTASGPRETRAQRATDQECHHRPIERPGKNLRAARVTVLGLIHHEWGGGGVADIS
jgi:hypothetical protein